MRLLDDVFLISARGLAPDSAVELAREGHANGAAPYDFSPSKLNAWLLTSAPASGRGARREVRWPDRAKIRDEAKRLERMDARVAWAGSEHYPIKLAAGLGEKTPPWVLIAGEAERLAAPQCAVIGSRTTPPELLEAAERLGRELAEARIVVSSGMAAGADRAAHRGAAEGAAGTLAVPAQGLLGVEPRWCGHLRSAVTLLGLGLPGAGFQTGVAIARNHAIAALSEALVLVASGVRGGSSYALKWALGHGRPVWCFENGNRTPEANARLLAAGHARPLSLGMSAESWAAEISEEIGRGPKAAETSEVLQLDWLG